MARQNNGRSPRRRKSADPPVNPAGTPPPAAPVPLPPPPPEVTPPDEQLHPPSLNRIIPGRLASQVQRCMARWFVPGLIPANCLSFVVGDPSTGKSTFGAWLCSQAKAPAILPGQEEDPAFALVPRLAAHRVRLERCVLLDDRLWSVPYDRRALTDVLRAHKADLLWVDPVDSYVGECGENDGQAVRAALEALARVARDTPCTIVCARHPGKSPGNICPGSRQWRAVPREIVELRHDQGPPSQRVLRCRKNPYNAATGPQRYDLVGAQGEPPLFKLGEAVAADLADTLGLTDPVDRWKVDEASELLRALLGEAEQESSWIYQQAELQRLSERTVRYAARRLGVTVRREGVGREHRSFWALPVSTPATPAK